KTCGHRQADPPCRPFRSFERPGGPRRTGKPTIPGLVQAFRGPKHHEPARPPCPQSSGTCRQGLAGSRGPRARREQPVVSLARSGAAAQTGQQDIDPARVAESCAQRRHLRGVPPRGLPPRGLPPRGLPPRGQTEFQVNLKLGLTPCPPPHAPWTPCPLAWCLEGYIGTGHFYCVKTGHFYCRSTVCALASYTIKWFVLRSDEPRSLERN